MLDPHVRRSARLRGRRWRARAPFRPVVCLDLEIATRFSRAVLYTVLPAIERPPACHILTSALPQEIPAPKAHIKTVSPALIRPSRVPSSSASGMEALDVLP